MFKQVFLRVTDPRSTLYPLVFIGIMNDDEDVSAVLSRAPTDPNGLLPDGLPLNVERRVLVEHLHAPETTSGTATSQPRVSASDLGKRKRTADDSAGTYDQEAHPSSTSGSLPFSSGTLPSSVPSTQYESTAVSGVFAFQVEGPGISSSYAQTGEPTPKRPRVEPRDGSHGHPDQNALSQAQGEVFPAPLESAQSSSDSSNIVAVVPTSSAVTSSRRRTKGITSDGRSVTDKIKSCQRYYREHAQDEDEEEEEEPSAGQKRKRKTPKAVTAPNGDDEGHEEEGEPPAKKERRRGTTQLRNSTCPKGEDLARALGRGPFFVEGQRPGGAKKLAIEHGMEGWQANSINVACSNWLKARFSEEECAMFRRREEAAKKSKKPNAPGGQSTQQSSRQTSRPSSRPAGTVTAGHTGDGDTAHQYPETGAAQQGQFDQGESANVSWPPGYAPVAPLDPSVLMPGNGVFDEASLQQHLVQDQRDSQGQQAQGADATQSLWDEPSELDPFFQSDQALGFLTSPVNPGLGGFHGTQWPPNGPASLPGADLSGLLLPAPDDAAFYEDPAAWIEMAEWDDDLDVLAMWSDDELLRASDAALRDLAGDENTDA